VAATAWTAEFAFDAALSNALASFSAPRATGRRTEEQSKIVAVVRVKR
jgi:hypothetical protein